MNNNQMRISRISNLSKGKIKGVSFFERIFLKLSGYFDGKRSLPRENSSGEWISPHIDREVRSFDEFSSRIWGHLQIEEEGDYAHLGELMDSLIHTRAQLKDAETALEEASGHENTPDVIRKHGESRLTEEQVIARRVREKENRLAPFKAKVDSLRNKLSAEIDSFSQLFNKIIEDNNSTRMICNRVKDHLHQRIDVYWNAALLKHSDNKMPVIPCVVVSSNAEEAYMEPHKPIMKRAELLSQSLSEDEKEAA